MEEIKKDSERTWYLIKDWITSSGLRARVHQCVWDKRVTDMAPSLHPFYCGYVQVPERTTPKEKNLDVHGGITFSLGKLMELEGNWIGFDMAHYDDGNNQDIEYAVAECEKLAAQLK